MPEHLVIVHGADLVEYPTRQHLQFSGVMISNTVDVHQLRFDDEARRERVVCNAIDPTENVARWRRHQRLVWRQP